MAKYYYTLDENGRIGMTAPVGFGVPAEEDVFDFPESFEFSRQYEYKIIDGELIHAPLPVPEETASPEERIEALEEALALLLSGVTE